MKVGDIIRELRKQHGMTQAELAKLLKTAPTTVATWEQHKNKPLIDKIVKMSEIFNKPVEYLLGEMVNEKDPYSSEQESKNEAMIKLESIANKHGYELTDPAILDVFNDFLDMLKRVKKQ